MHFIETIVPMAKKVAKQYGILPSLLIAQAVHESNHGKSKLAVEGKNLFGIKGEHKGLSVRMLTKEFINGEMVTTEAAFRKYPTWGKSIEDLAQLYKNGVSWDRNKYRGIIGETDYKKAVGQLQASGYATDPDYGRKIIRIIETYQLLQYDNNYLSCNMRGEMAGEVDEGLEVVEIVYPVKSGDTLSGIAAAFKTSVSQLQMINHIRNPDFIVAGQIIKTGEKHYFYTVHQGDTVTAIAKQFKQSPKKIAEWNQLQDINDIKIGEKMRVK